MTLKASAGNSTQTGSLCSHRRKRMMPRCQSQAIVRTTQGRGISTPKMRKALAARDRRGEPVEVHPEKAGERSIPAVSRQHFSHGSFPRIICGITFDAQRVGQREECGHDVVVSPSKYRFCNVRRPADYYPNSVMKTFCTICQWPSIFSSDS
jgi:hypothetical protein